MASPSVPLVAPAQESGEPRLFTALLSPYRSLSARGFTILMLAIAGVSFVVGVAFVSMGAWPIAGFFGLDVLLVWLAFRRNYRDARAFEEIILTRTGLTVRAVGTHGATVEHRFDPYWTRLEIERRPFGTTRLALTSSGRRLAIGAFLPQDDRDAFARALQKALAEARSIPAA